MAYLGEFGRAIQDAEGEPDHFSFYGDQFVVPARASSLPIAKFAWQTKVFQKAQSQAEERRDIARGMVQRARSQEEWDDAQLAEATASGEVVQAGLDSLAAIWEYLRSTITDETEFERLYVKAIEVGADTDELFEVCAQIVQAVAGRPTRRPSGSSDGPSSTGRGSTVPSVSGAPTSGPEPHGTQVWEPPVAQSGWAPPPMTAAEKQRAEFREQMRPVGELVRTRSGG